MIKLISRIVKLVQKSRVDSKSSVLSETCDLIRCKFWNFQNYKHNGL